MQRKKEIRCIYIYIYAAGEGELGMLLEVSGAVCLTSLFEEYVQVDKLFLIQFRCGQGWNSSLWSHDPLRHV